MNGIVEEPLVVNKENKIQQNGQTKTVKKQVPDNLLLFILNNKNHSEIGKNSGIVDRYSQYGQNSQAVD